MLVRSRKGSLFALFSPKLWTVLNQYGAGGPCVMGLREWPPDIEFENLSFDQFKLVRLENPIGVNSPSKRIRIFSSSNDC